MADKKAADTDFTYVETIPDGDINHLRAKLNLEPIAEEEVSSIRQARRNRANAAYVFPLEMTKH